MKRRGSRRPHHSTPGQQKQTYVRSISNCGRPVRDSLSLTAQLVTRPRIAGGTVGRVIAHEMSAGNAIEILDALADHDVDVCVGGGWAVDALVGRQSRVHGDLDLWVPAAHFDRAILAFVELEIDRLYPWGDDRP